MALFKDTKLIVFDMAGTTVNEGGIVYQVLKNTLNKFKIPFTTEEFNKFHGINKKEVLNHFIRKQNSENNRLESNTNFEETVYLSFKETLKHEYFVSDKISPMPGAIDLFRKLRQHNIKVGLDTGYPREIADKILEKVGFKNEIDASVTSDEVSNGRPDPYMIHALMNKVRVNDVKSVIKVGDTIADIIEGKNAYTKAQIGVLSGAEDFATLSTVRPTIIVNSIQDLQNQNYYSN